MVGLNTGSSPLLFFLLNFFFLLLHDTQHVSVSQIPANLTFDHEFGKCKPIAKIFHCQIPEGTLCNYYNVFHLTLTVLLHYLAKFKVIK